MIPPKYYQLVKKQFNTHQWNGLKIIAAVSGGADSMALCCFLLHLQVPFVIAHCNFQLRGAESDGDELHVQQWAQEHNVKCYTQRFDVAGQLARDGGNLQQICRDLRYNWFEQLRLKINYDRIAVAHHKDDVAETVLMNLLKGTGVAGLHGILAENNKIIRPLLAITREDILHVLSVLNVTWREDSSNAKDVYLRNKIRHQLMPMLESILPQAIDGIYQTSLKIQDVEQITKPVIHKLTSKLQEKRGKDVYISIALLKKQNGFATLLYELLKPFGIQSGQMSDVISLLDAHTAKSVLTPSYKIIKNRGFLIITENVTINTDFIEIDQLDKEKIKFADGQLLLERMAKMPDVMSNSEVEYINADVLKFPLILRRVKEGDYFYPIGMNNKKKKVSKLLKDLKMPIHEKEHVWVLTTEDKIISILGIRMDERFKISTTTKEVLRIEYKKEDAAL